MKTRLENYSIKIGTFLLVNFFFMALAESTPVKKGELLYTKTNYQTKEKDPSLSKSVPAYLVEGLILSKSASYPWKGFFNTNGSLLELELIDPKKDPYARKLILFNWVKLFQSKKQSTPSNRVPDALTGATISYRAIEKAILEASETIRKNIW